MTKNNSATTPARGPTAQLTAEEKQILLRLARQTLEDCLSQGKAPGPDTNSPALLEHRASFVTLTERDSGELRGCRGEYRACQPLIESVAQMSIASATDDPRFPPVTLEELGAIRIEINVLTEPVSILPDQIVVGRHGLLIKSGYHSGLLLPEVPVQYGWNQEEFLVWLCRKAGLPENGWTAPDARLFGFEAEVWGE